MEPLWILLHTTIATLVVALISFSAARLRFSLSTCARTVLDVLFLAPLLLSPSLLAWIILLFLGHSESGIPIAEDALTAIPIFYLCACMGFRHVRKEWNDAARMQGSGPCGIFWHVWFPPARSWLAVGLAFGLIRAWILPGLAYFQR